MRVLLAGKYSIVEPLGLMFLEATLRRMGADVEIILFGADPQEKRLTYDQDFICLSAYTGYHTQMFRVSNWARMGHGIKTVIGGPHATFFSDECLTYADYVVIGEGFKSLPLVYSGKVEKGKVFTHELVSEEEIPTPYRKTLYQTYKTCYQNPIKSVISSLGCPYQCSYCYTNSYNRLYENTVVRYRSVEAVVDECLELKTYPLELIFFQDDCFGFKLEWLEKFADRYWRMVGVPFHCQLRPEMVTIERMELLKSAGCHGVTLAIESFNESYRREMLNRKMSNKEIFQACTMVKEFGFKLRTEQMLGLPATTFEDELGLLEMNIKIRPNIAWSSIYTPYLGTWLGDFCKKTGLYSGNNDDLEATFFSKSKLNFDKDRLRKTNQLQTMFSTCAQFPDGHKLAKNFMDKDNYNWKNWFEVTRKHLYDESLYKVGD